MSVLRSGQSLNPRFTLIRSLGQGGTAEVWLVRDLELDEEVAAKVVSPVVGATRLALLRREFRNIRRLQHPGIIRIFDLHRGVDDHHFLTMEYMAGGDIGHLRGRPAGEIVAMALPVAGALQHAHEAGVVHRDLKVGNVLCDAAGRPRLTDFGIAAVLRHTHEEVTGGGSGFNISPQQLDGESGKPADDIYAFGVLLFELVTGHPPFFPDLTPERIRDEMPPPLRSAHPLPARLQSLVAAMLAKRPGDRPAGVEEIRKELELIHGEVGGGSKVGSGSRAEGGSGIVVGGEVATAPEPEAPVRLSPPPRVPTIEPITPHRSRREDSGPAAATPSAPTGVPGAAPRPGQPPPLVAAREARRSRWPYVSLALVSIVVIIQVVFFLIPGWTGQGDDDGIESGGGEAAPIDGGNASGSGGATGAGEPGAGPMTGASSEKTPAPATGTFTAATTPEEKRTEAYLKTQAGDLIHQAGQLEAALEAKGVTIWGGEDHFVARARMAAGDDQFKAGDYAGATAAYREAVDLLQRVESRSQDILQQALADGEQSLAAGDATTAAAAFHLATRIAPGHAGAAAGLRSAENMDEVGALLEQGRQQERNGQLIQAETSYRQAAALDPASQAAQTAIADVRARIKEDAFSAAMSVGLAALDAGDHAASREALSRAEGIRPGSSLVADALARVEVAEKLVQITAHRERAVALAADEKWHLAAAEYQAVLKLDPSLVFAQEGSRRSQERAALADALDYHLAHPERLSAADVRGEADTVLARAMEIINTGPRHQHQVEQLESLLQTMSQAVSVTLESDNLTEVTIYKVGRLGTFERKQMELHPGTYTVVGQRRGYRDVRHRLEVKAGEEIAPLAVRCEEKI